MSFFAIGFLGALWGSFRKRPASQLFVPLAAPLDRHTQGVRRVAVLGSTGSIGVQTLDVCRQFPHFQPATLVCQGSNLEAFVEQIKEFRPQMVGVADESKVDELMSLLVDIHPKPQVVAGSSGLCACASLGSVDVVITGIAGIAGLLPTIAAIKAGKDIGLANKETLISAGPLIHSLMKNSTARILPVDSEHSALFQCLQGVPPGSVERLLLTGSGGPFRDLSVEEFKRLDKGTIRKMASTHPTYDMGAKITVDSATMMNKGLEVIEAHFLYGLDFDHIDAVIHPQSIVHSMVELKDGAVLGQMGWPDMKIPIMYALSYPHRETADFPHPRLGHSFKDFWKSGSLDFREPDFQKYPCLELAYRAGRMGGLAPCILSGANEQAVHKFLSGAIEFVDIPDILTEVMNGLASYDLTNISLEGVIAADQYARTRVDHLVG